MRSRWLKITEKTSILSTKNIYRRINFANSSFTMILTRISLRRRVRMKSRGPIFFEFKYDWFRLCFIHIKMKTDCKSDGDVESRWTRVKESRRDKELLVWGNLTLLSIETIIITERGRRSCVRWLEMFRCGRFIVMSLNLISTI